MDENFFDTGATPQITITAVGGNLTVQSWMRQSVACEGAEAKAEMPQMGQLTVSGPGDVALSVPAQSQLSIEQVSGRTIIKHIAGDLTIKEAVDVDLNDVGQAILETVAGNLTAENVNGRLVAQSVSQNATLRRVAAVQLPQVGGTIAIQYANGFVDIGQAGGDITLHTVNGDVTIQDGTADTRLDNLGGRNQVQVAGALHLNGSLAQGEHHFAADGDLQLDWPFDAPGTFIVTAAQIENNLLLAGVNQTIEGEIVRLTGHIEEGLAIVVLQAGGRATLGQRRTLPDPDIADKPGETPPTASAPAPADELTTAVARALADVAAALSPQRAAALRDDPGLAARLATALRPYLAEAAATAAPSPAVSPGQQAFAAAERAVVQSLRKAQAHLAQTEQRLTTKREPELDDARQETAVAAEPDAASTKTTAATDATTADTEPTAQPTDRQHILQLLRDGQLSVKQADLLLEAL